MAVKRVLLVAASLLLISSAASAKTVPQPLCVNPGGTDGCLATIQDAVTAATSGSTITVAAGTYTENVVVQTGLKTLIINGAGPGQTIVDGGGASGLAVFSMRQSNVTLSGMTIENGSGGIGENIQFFTCNLGKCKSRKLIITDVEITGANSPTSLNAQGGGIWMDGGTLTLDSSSIHNNQTGIGGAIYIVQAKAGSALGKAVITNTTISDNTAGAGAIYFYNAQIYLNNVTIADNVATEANAGGLDPVSAKAKATFSNTIIAGNSANGVEDDCGDSGVAGKFVSKGYNVIGSTSGCGNTKFKSTDILNQSALLTALTYAPSCTTEVQVPEPGSPALNAGNSGKLSGKVGGHASGCLPTDQCGQARTQGSCDIGAVQQTATP